MKKFFLLLFISFLFIIISYGQSIKGVIIDNSKAKIAGAYVAVSSTENHTHSDDFGIFIIENVNKILTIELVESSFEFRELVVDQNTKEVNVISAIDIRLSPVKTSQESLKKVPGLFIGQYAEGCKAEQIFLRDFDIENLYDQEWNETQFATESRLRNETAPVEEIHFSPCASFFIKGILNIDFRIT